MRSTTVIIHLSTFATFLTGCMATTPYWDAQFGEAVRAGMAQQIVDPNGSHNRNPVAGIDGKAAQGAMSEYAKSYTRPEPQPNAFTIGVGGGSGR